MSYQHSDGDLWDLFVGSTATFAEIAAQDVSVLAQQVRELQQQCGWSPELDAADVARRLVDYAQHILAAREA